MGRWLSLLALVLCFSVGAQAADRADAQIQVPANYSAQVAWPVILLLHGYTSNSLDVDHYMQLSSRVDSRGFILVVPNGRKDWLGYQFWNASDACCDFTRLGGDDAGYLMGLLDQVRAKYNVDPHRIYVAGHSNGAFMAHRLVCDHSDVFAGIVSFSGETFQDAANCKANSPVSLLQIQAVDDNVVNYQGDHFFGMSPYPGSVATATQWAQRDGCAATTRAGALIDLTSSIPGDDTQPTLWSGCTAGTEVQLWTIAAHSESGYFAHQPALNPTYADLVLDFLLKQRKN